MKVILQQLIAETMKDVGDEVHSAIEIHGLYHSAHEAFGVLAEEVAEFFDEVRKKEGSRDLLAMQEELVQIAAVAAKAAVSLLADRRTS